MLRTKFTEQLVKYVIHEPNVFAVSALENAYCHSDDWYHELIIHLRENRLYISDFISKHFPKMIITQSESTYLVWVDYRGLDISPSDFHQWLMDDCKIKLTEGTDFGQVGYGFFRLNFACPHAMLEEALNSMKNNQSILFTKYSSCASLSQT